MAKAKEKVPTYEELYDMLLVHLDKLESGQLTLDESLKVYEEATQIADQCQKHLESAQQKLQMTEHLGEKA